MKTMDSEFLKTWCKEKELKLKKEKLTEECKKLNSDVLYKFSVKVFYYYISTTHGGVKWACSTYDSCER
jgi:hypothetical protein